MISHNSEILEHPQRMLRSIRRNTLPRTHDQLVESIQGYVTANMEPLLKNQMLPYALVKQLAKFARLTTASKATFLALGRVYRVVKVAGYINLNLLSIVSRSHHHIICDIITCHQAIITLPLDLDRRFMIKLTKRSARLQQVYLYFLSIIECMLIMSWC